MKEIIDKRLVKGSAVLLICFGIFNLLNFLFHFVMARVLTIEEYGVMAALFSLVYIFTVFSESIQLVITRFTAREDNKGKLKNIIKKSFKKSFYFSIIIFVIYLIASIFLYKYLKIEYGLMLINGLLIFVVFLNPINRGVLQGRKRFGSLGLNMIIESLGKIVFSLILVYLGFKVYGAVAGMILGALIAIIVSFLSIKEIIVAKEETAETGGIYSYTRPAFLITLAITVFYSLDIIIAKILFSDSLAGAYSIASIVSKTVFWGTQPISRAMFPLSAEGNYKDKDSEKVFNGAIFFLLFLVIIAMVLFYFLPELIIKIFSGKDSVISVKIVFYLGIAMSLLSFTNIILLHRLSIEKVRGYPYLLLALIIEIFLLFFFSNNLVQFSIAMITSTAILFCITIFLIKE